VGEARREPVRGVAALSSGMLFLLACTRGAIDLPGERVVDTAAPGLEVLPDADPRDTTEGDDTDGCPTLYRQDLLPEFDLRIDAADLDALRADYTTGTKAWHPAAFVWLRPDGTEDVFEDAQVRLRGNPGFSWLGEKMQFAVSFTEVDPDGRFHGLRKMALDASWYNGSGARNRLSYAYLRAAGTPAPCTNFAFLSINGAPYGMYENIEFLDQEFLERVYGRDAAGGALWKYGSVPTTNEDEADADAMNAYWADASVSNQQALSDLDANMLEWAAEAVLPQNDGYWCCNHNFYLYDHPEDGLSFVPWDMDYTLDATPYWADPYTWYRDSAWQPHFDAVVTDPDLEPRLVDAVRRAAEAYDPDVLLADLDAWEAQSEELYALDPTTPHSVGTRRDGFTALRQYVPARRAWIDSWVDCHSGETADLDADGFGPCADCDAADDTISPGAAEVCNGRDDDCNGLTDDDPSCSDCQEFSWEGERLLMCPSPRTYEAARAVCQSHGGDLGYPVSTGAWYVLWLSQYWDELAWAGVTAWWGGPTDLAQEGVWRAADGSAVSPGWASGEPNGGLAEGCAVLSPSTWQWYDAGCTLELPSVCTL
jgi:hypothetical protein